MYSRLLLRELVVRAFCPVARCGQFQLIAAGVIVEGLGIIFVVLVTLAQGKTQMVSVHRLGGRIGLGPLHLLDLGLLKVIGFDIGQAPPGIAMIRLDLRCPLIGLDSPWRSPRDLSA